MMQDDLTVFPFYYLLKAYAGHADLEERAYIKCKAFVAFMDENGLFKNRPYEGQEPPRDLAIRESHLSAEGKVLFRNQAIDRWLDRNDDITKPISMRVLERELKKLRG